MKKRILVVSPVPTHPVTSGNRARIATMLELLEKLGHCVHFAHILQEKGDEPAMKSYWGERYHPVSYSRKPPSVARKIARKIISQFEPDAAYVKSIDEWYDSRLDDFFLKLDRKLRFDVVIAEYVFFSKVLNCFREHVVKVIDTHDVFTNRHKLYLENGKQPPWFSTSKRQESKGLNRADIIIAIQERERQILAGLCKRPVITVGHSVALITPEDKTPSYNLLYVGSGNPINVQSVNYFVRKIFPKIQASLPELRFLIAGTICDEVHEPGDNIVKLGRVSELSSVYEKADIVINPMIYGTGLKVKNIEALGYSKPLITSPIGAEGMEEGKGTAFLVASTDADWNKLVVTLMQNGNYRSSLSQGAYEFAYNWNKKIEENLASVIGFNQQMLKVS